MKFIKQSLANERRWIFGLIGVFTGLYSLYGWVRHYRFESWGFDLGIYDQALWLYSRFYLPLSTIKIPNMIVLGDHFSPSFALLSPIYWLVADVRWLIFWQAFLFCLGAWPLYLLAKSVLRQKFLPLVIALGYLIFWGSQYALTFDVHMITFGAALLPWLFYFLHCRRWLGYWLAFFLALGFKEDMSIILFSLGVYAILRYRFYRIGISSMVVSFIWLLLVSKVFIPSLAGSFPYAAILPTNLIELQNILFHPAAKWVAVFWSFFAFAFLPLLGWAALPMIALHFLVHWLDPRFFGRWEMALHYRVPLAAMLAVGAIWGIHSLSRRVLPLVFSLGLLSTLAITQFYLHLPLNTLLKPAFYERDGRFAGIEELMTKIPPEASVITQNNIAAHLSHRRQVYLTSPKERKCPGEKNCDWLAFDDSDYILVDLTAGQGANNFWGYSPGGIERAVNNMTSAGRYRLEDKRGKIYLYRRIP